MKILHTADWHIGKKLENFSRLAEQEIVMDEICRVAEQEEVDLVLVAGDLYDNPNPGAEANTLLYKTLHRLSNNGRRAVIAIAGNHDAPSRIDAPHPLAQQNGIIMVGDPMKAVDPFALDSGLQVLNSAPGFVELKLPHYNYPVRVLLTPYASELTLRQYLDRNNEEEELRRILDDRWTNQCETWCDEKGVNLLTAHLFVMQKGKERQEEPDDERPILHIGGASPVFTENIPEAIQYVALGHLHRYQHLKGAGCPVVYSSSPLAYSFNEENQQKYVALVKAEPGKEAEVKGIPLQQGYRLVRERFTSEEDALEWLAQNPHCYCEITLVSNMALSSESKQRLYSQHERLLGIVPELTGPDEQNENPAVTGVNVRQDIRILFREYFQQKHNGQEPDESIMQLFDEIRNTTR